MEVTALEAARSSTSPLSLDWKTILGIKSYDQKRLASLSPKTRTFGRSRVSFLLAGPPDLWADLQSAWLSVIIGNLFFLPGAAPGLMVCQQVRGL